MFKMFKTFSIISLFLLTLSFSVFAGTVNVTFVNGGTGASNGAVYVGPYNLIVDGVDTSATCINSTLEVGPPNSWTASVIPFTNYSGATETELLELEWLNIQFGFDSDWVGIHQAIWNINLTATQSGISPAPDNLSNTPGPPQSAPFTDADTLSWVAKAETSTNYGSVNLDNYALLLSGSDPLVQSFLITNPSPEPTTMALFGSGLIGIGLLFRKKTAKTIN
jgi:hypothetical protein